MKIQDLFFNDKNPRIWTDARIKKLAKSITDFPEMMELRRIILDEKNLILAGNMRVRALMFLGYEDIPKKWYYKVSNLTESQKDEFLIKDNIHLGDWDYSTLAEKFGAELLEDWAGDAISWPEHAPQEDRNNYSRKLHKPKPEELRSFMSTSEPT